MTRFHWTDIISLALITFQVLAAGVALYKSEPTQLGITPVALNWIILLSPVAGVLLNQLKALGQPPSTTPTDPPKSIKP